MSFLLLIIPSNENSTIAFPNAKINPSYFKKRSIYTNYKLKYLEKYQDLLQIS